MISELNWMENTDKLDGKWIFFKLINWWNNIVSIIGEKWSEREREEERKS